jgi:hypothetical protein
MDATVRLIQERGKTISSPDSDAREEDWVRSFEERVRGEIEGVRGVEEVEALLPTLPLQMGVIYRSLEDPQLYVQHFVCHLGNSTEVGRLRACWGRVQVEVEILRSVSHRHSFGRFLT